LKHKIQSGVIARQLINQDSINKRNKHRPLNIFLGLVLALWLWQFNIR